MNAETKVENTNLAIWNELSRTDPKHTKSFSRAGGFKGTAIKPIWIVKMLTEQFGPCGEGWGMGEPTFQVVHAEGEVLVYCTVKCWHGSPENGFYGVGGDKVVVQRSGGPFRDDEAFKKAYTDAVGNAFKFLGVGADVHMGLFDDSKYVAEVTAEYAEPAPETKVEGITKIKQRLSALMTAGNAAADLEAFNALVHDNRDDLTKIKDANHGWWTGDGEDFEGYKAWIRRRREELAAEPEYGGVQKLIDSMNDCETLDQFNNWLAANGDDIDALSDADRRTFEHGKDFRESIILESIRPKTKEPAHPFAGG
jgi:hypothetical protein